MNENSEDRDQKKLFGYAMNQLPDTLRHAQDQALMPNVDLLDSPLDVHAVQSVFRKHSKLFINVFGGIFIAASLIVLLMPKKYEAEMKLLVKSERPDLLVTPQSNVNTVHVNELSETQINTEIELLRSTDVLRQVAFQSGLTKPESGTVLAAGEVSPVSLDKALKRLQQDLVTSAIKKSDIIDVTYTSKSPTLATSVLKHLADNYLMAHLKVHANPGTFAFFDEQAKFFQERLAVAEAQLKDFRERNSSFGMPDQNDILATRAVEAQTAFEEVDAQIADYKQRIAQSQDALNKLSPRLITQTHVLPQIQLVQSLSQTLMELQNRRTDLLLKFNADDPFVKQIDKQIADTNGALKQARAQNAEETASDINPVRENTEKELVTSQVALSGLVAKKDTLAETVASYKKKMADAAEATVDMESLARQVKENEENYLLYQKKREEARIADSLDRDRITNVAVIQEPTTPVQPSSPRITLDLILSFIFALFIATVTVLFVEFMRPQVPPVSMVTNSTALEASAS